MTVASRAGKLSFALNRGITPSLYWLLILAVCLASSLTLVLIGLSDARRLVPISLVYILDAIPLMLLLYFSGIVVVFGFSTIPDRLGLFTIAFFLRVIVSITLALIFQYDDEYVFHVAGLEQRYKLFSRDASWGYYKLVGMLYTLFSPNLLLPKLVNSFLGSLLPFFAYELGQKIFNSRKSARYIFLLNAFLPPLVIFSSVNLKEIGTAFLMLLILWFLVIPHKLLILKIIGITVSISTLYWLRGAPWAAISLAGVVTYITLGEVWHIRYLVNFRFLLKLIIAGTLIFFALSSLVESSYERALSRLTRETYYIERFSDSSATIMQFVDVSNPLSPKNLVILFLRGLYTPFPFRFLVDYSLSTIIEAFVMIVWYVLFPFAVIGFLTERHKGVVIACGIVVLGILAMSTIGLMVGSDPYRHRVTIMGLLFILAGGGFTREVIQKNRWVFYLWWSGALLFIVSWIMFRM
jgi:hypothetical protein